MATSYLDLGLNPIDVQQGAAGALQQQVSQRLLVTPRVDLRAAFQTALTNRDWQNRLALMTRQNDLKAQSIQAERRQMPWTTGFGALRGALDIYGGYRDLRAANQAKAVTQQQLDFQRQMQQQSALTTAQHLEQYGALRQALEAQGYAPQDFLPPS